MQFQIDASNFSGSLSSLNGAHTAHCTSVRLALASVMMGHGGYRSVIEAGMWRAIQLISGTYPYVTSTPTNHIKLHERFVGELSDEKRIASYRIGMALSKIAAEELLDIPWLFHFRKLKDHFADVYRGKLVIAKLVYHYGKPKDKKATEPDFIGFKNSNSCFPFESKGMQAHSGAEIQHAIEQVSQVTSVTEAGMGNPVPITARVVCASVFRPHFRMEMIDPVINSADGEGIQLSLDLASMLKAYYSVVLVMLNGAGQRLPDPLQDFVGVTLDSPEIGTWHFGLHQAVLEWINAANGPDLSEMQRVKDRMRRIRNTIPNTPDVAISLDGTVLAKLR